MLSDANLQNAFRYFSVPDEGFYAHMLRCAAAIREDPRACGVFSAARAALFGGEIICRDAIAALQEQLCGDSAPTGITSLLLLTSYDALERKATVHHLSGYDLWFAKDRIQRIARGPWRRGTKNVWYELFLWCADLANGNEPFCGSLIFQRYSDRLVHIHIPPHGDLSPDMVRQSIAMAPAMLRWRFGLEQWVTVCESWLLSPEIRALAPRGSNIARFSDFFTVTPGESCLDSVLDIVFHAGAETDFHRLPENTTLQRAVKQHLLSGGSLRIGNGILQDG